MKFILGKKLAMTQVFASDGTVVPVTRVLVGPCQITQIKKDTVQIGFGETKEFRLSKPEAGHLKGLNLVKNLRDFKVEKTDGLNRGDLIDLTTFTAGEKVEVTGFSKGKGFQGVVKRHGFHGQGASHGVKDQQRMPGSIGAQGPQHVFKGKRMGGRMGGDRITVKNLEVISVDPNTNEICLKGAVPGARNGLLMISGAGEIKILKTEKAEEVKTEEVNKVNEVNEVEKVEETVKTS